ncbi:MAG: M23 family metallopeptidase, partial [Anaerolineae bacterium]|nr:M23 family metallopeptidase [Anaerolineae bacterium]
LLLFLASCAQDGTPTPQRLAGQTPDAPQPTSTATATPTLTQTPTLTPKATNTPTPTPTPTATAPPAEISGDPRAYAQRPPEPQPGAACGLVDIFDFPVGPPDAVDVSRGGTDYNRYRERYNGFHAGEDWSGPNGRNLGSPVYSIGHGRVIYAHPNGWGVDQGVLIIQHVFADGSTILSFYGHLDPPSVVLRGGECVARGDKVGEIGDPRGRPHLHFEIRNHMPGEPGPGYWFQDPTLAGWFPPSQTIWANRIAASPGYLWTSAPNRGDLFAGKETAGFLPGDVLVLLEGGRLQGIGASDGGVRWTQPAPPTPTPQPEATPDPTRIAIELAAAAPVSAVPDEVEPLLYAIDRHGRMRAYATGGEAPVFDEPLWLAELATTGDPALYALPGGGVVVVGRREAIALSSGGNQLWSLPLDELPGPAVRAGGTLFLPVGRSAPTLWLLDRRGASAWSALPAGTPIGHLNGALWFYTREAVYRLDAAARTSHLALLLPRATPGAAAHGAGDAMALPDGGLLVAHPDARDRRLLRLDAAGSLIWERSYREAGNGQARLALLDDQVYLVVSDEGATTLVTLFRVDLETGNLVRLFTGGTREGIFGDTWVLPASSGVLLLNIGGGHLVALDPRAAAEAVAPGR